MACRTQKCCTAAKQPHPTILLLQNSPTPLYCCCKTAHPIPLLQNSPTPYCCCKTAPPHYTAAEKQPHPTIPLLQNSPTPQYCCCKTENCCCKTAPPHALYRCCKIAAAKQLHKTAPRYGTPQPSQRNSLPIVYSNIAAKQLEPLAKRARFYMFIVKPSIW